MFSLGNFGRSRSALQSFLGAFCLVGSGAKFEVETSRYSPSSERPLAGFSVAGGVLNIVWRFVSGPVDKTAFFFFNVSLLFGVLIGEREPRLLTTVATTTKQLP